MQSIAPFIILFFTTTTHDYKIIKNEFQKLDPFTMYFIDWKKKEGSEATYWNQSIHWRLERCQTDKTRTTPSVSFPYIGQLTRSWREREGEREKENLPRQLQKFSHIDMGQMTLRPEAGDFQIVISNRRDIEQHQAFLNGRYSFWGPLLPLVIWLTCFGWKNPTIPTQLQTVTSGQTRALLREHNDVSRISI